LFRTGAP